MRKTQVALAALALVASTAAMADVTVYGNIEAGIANTSMKQGATAAGQGPAGASSIGSYFSGNAAYTAGSYWGLRGSEDLGNGLKANFNLEAGLDAGNGSSSNGGTAGPFSRLANVGLSGDFGSLSAGLQLSPFIASAAGTGMQGNGHFFVNRLLSIAGSKEFLTNAGTAGPGGGSGGFFVPNAVSYTSPSFSGWTATALTSTKTGSNGGGTVADPAQTNSYQAYSLTGAIGALNTSFAYHKRADTYTASSASANTKLADITLSANYISAKYDDANTDAMAGVRVNSWAVGAGYNFSDALSATLQYAKNNISGGNQSLTGLGLQYNLSKRTLAYFSYTTATNGASSSYDQRVNITNAVYGGATAGESNHTTAVGIAHSF